MFKFKSPKVFEKINKMNRKQAYTVGAIVVVSVVVLILLISSFSVEEDDSFAGLNSRGYDLAQMPFATDEAEKYLLSNVYPDMQENGSSLLYTALDKEKRQEEDGVEEDEPVDLDFDDEDTGSTGYSDDSDGSGSSRGYGGYGGGYGGRGGGSKTEIGTLSNSGMATSSSSGVNSTWGPSGDFRQFRGREDKGKEKPTQLKTDDARRALAQFRSGSLASARLNENKMKNAGKALFGGNIQGSDAFNKDGTVDLDKLKSGGFTLDTSAPSTTTDLDNLDKKVADAAKKAQDKPKDEDKPNFWTDLWQGLVKNMANKLVDTFTSAMGDAIVGARQAYVERDAYRKNAAGLGFDKLNAADQAYLSNRESGAVTANDWSTMSFDERVAALRGSPGESAASQRGFNSRVGYTNESSTNRSDTSTTTQVGAGESNSSGSENNSGANGTTQQ